MDIDLDTGGRSIRLRFMPNPTPIHGHEVLRLLGTYPDGCCLDTLREVIAEKYGDKPVFVNCRDMQFDLDGLINFFLSREKITMVGNMIQLTGAPPCDNERQE